MPAMNVTGSLTLDEAYLGSLAGVRRRIQSLGRGQTNRVGNPNFGWDHDVEGALAEMFACKMMNLYWDGSVNTFKAPDVGGVFQIRHTAHDNGHLILQTSDKDSDWFVLVTGKCPHYTLRGAMLGSEGKQPHYWRERDLSQKVYSAAYYVPQPALRDMKALICQP